MKKLRFNKKTKRSFLILGVVLLFVIIMVVILVTQQSKHEQSSKQEEKDREPKNEEIIPEKKIQIINLDSDSRNIAVMINNIKTVWGYQSGIQDAYIVYEMIVEGGFTRLMAVFKDQTTERIGSVRSARPYYLDYVLENDAIYVHFGGSDQALSDINTLQIPNINFLYSSGYWRDRTLKLATEHTAYTSMNLIQEQISKKNYRNTTSSSPVLNYSNEEIDLSKIEGSQVANKVYIEYSGSRNTSFEYDPENKIYKRFQNGVTHTDYVTKQQYTTKNIITYQVENHSLDSYGRQALSNLGSGNGYYISNGYAVPITWEKTSRSEKTVYKLLDGTKLKVNDGNTYIQIQPKNKPFTIE